MFALLSRDWEVWRSVVSRWLVSSSISSPWSHTKSSEMEGLHTDLRSSIQRPLGNSGNAGPYTSVCEIPEVVTNNKAADGNTQDAEGLNTELCALCWTVELFILFYG